MTRPRKGWKVVGFLGSVFGGLFLHSRRARAAGPGRPRPPSNVRTVDSKLTALPVAAAVAAGGSFIVVAVDKAHRSAAATIIAKRARRHSTLEYVIIDMDLARALAAERPGTLKPIPADAWGGVAAIVDKQVVMHTYFRATDNLNTEVAVAEEVLLWEREALPPAESSVASGLLALAPPT